MDWKNVNNEQAFYEASKNFQIKSLGQSIYGELGPDGKPAGYLFSAYRDRAVEEILPKLKD